MKDPKELNDDELKLILSILKQLNHQYDDYSDVHVGHMISANRISQQPWLPQEFYKSTHNTIDLLNFYCEYGFLEPSDFHTFYKVTKYGLEFLKMNYKNIL